MDYGIIVAPTLKELFIEKIENMILSGKLAIGDKLPTERELSVETRISKSVVHAGLVELERMGFVTIVPRKGIFVANYAEKGTLDTLMSILKYNGGKLDRHQVESLFEVRLAIEGTALRKLAINHTQDDIKALEGVIAGIEAFIEENGFADLKRVANEVFEFHHTVCIRSGNLMFPLILNAFKSITIVFWQTTLKLIGVENYIKKMKGYFMCIKNGDADGAVALLSSALEEYLKLSGDL